MGQVQEKSRFSWIFNDDSEVISETWNREIVGSPSFTVIPSLGALVPGWLLIVPRRPITSLKLLNNSERAELLGLVKMLTFRLSEFGSTTYCFEHGSTLAGSVVGCGVDQAHLHIVPLKFNLLNAVAQRSASVIEWNSGTKFIPLKGLPDDAEYVTVWNAITNEGLVGAVINPLSQWVRRVIAAELGIEDEWDYRKNPQIENVEQTLKAMDLK